MVDVQKPCVAQRRKFLLHEAAAQTTRGGNEEAQHRVNRCEVPARRAALARAAPSLPPRSAPKVISPGLHSDSHKELSVPILHKLHKA